MSRIELTLLFSALNLLHCIRISKGPLSATPSSGQVDWRKWLINCRLRKIRYVQISICGLQRLRNWSLNQTNLLMYSSSRILRVIPTENALRIQTSLVALICDMSMWRVKSRKLISLVKGVKRKSCVRLMPWKGGDKVAEILAFLTMVGCLVSFYSFSVSLWFYWVFLELLLSVVFLDCIVFDDCVSAKVQPRCLAFRFRENQAACLDATALSRKLLPELRHCLSNAFRRRNPRSIDLVFLALGYRFLHY